MARLTDTRQRVRDAAEQLLAEGSVPTPTAIRKMLGGGSPNTIVDELRQWRLRQGRPASIALPTSGQAPPGPAPEATDDPAEQRRTSEGDLAPAVEAIRKAAAELGASQQTLARLVEGLRSLEEQRRADRAWFEDELAKAYERFDAVQKAMMLQVSEARDQVKFWKDEAMQQREDANSWRLGQGQLQSTLREEIARLKGRLEAYEGSDGGPSAAAEDSPTH